MILEKKGATFPRASHCAFGLKRLESKRKKRQQMTKQQGTADSTASKILDSLHGQRHFSSKNNVSEMRKDGRKSQVTATLLFMEDFSAKVISLSFSWVKLLSTILSYG